MLLAHVAGAVVLGLWLSMGESALWSLLHLAATRAVVALAAAEVLTALRATARGAMTVRLVVGLPSLGFVPLPRLDRPGVSHRGPPALLAA